MDLLGRISGRFRSSVSGIGLHIEDSELFCRTQCNSPWILCCIVRFILALYYTISICYLLIYQFQLYFFIYLTHWTALVFTIYLVVASVNVIIDRKYWMKYDNAERETIFPLVLSCRHKLQWFLMIVYTNMSIIVTIVYWSVLYSPDPSLLYYNLTAHTFPSILGVLDILLTPIPVRIIHVVYPVSFALTYMIFTLIYWAAGGTDPSGNSAIYTGFLDWDGPGMTSLSMFLCAIGITVCQFVLWGLFRLKMVLYNRLVPSSSYDRLDEEEIGNYHGNEDNGKVLE